MAIVTQAGYTWNQGRNARLLHAGNRFSIQSYAASAGGDTADLVGNELTRDRWVPFTNEIIDEEAFNAAAWAATGVTLSSDGRTLTEDTSTGEHKIAQAFTFLAQEYVFAVTVDRRSVPEIQLAATDGSGTFSAFFDLRDGSTGAVASAGAAVVRLDENRYLCRAYFTTGAGAGSVEVRLSNGSEDVTYTGAQASIRVERAVLHASSATLSLTAHRAQGGTLFAIGAHTLGTSAARVTFEHDSNGDGTYTSLGSTEPTDDSSIMFFFSAVTSDRWRITVDRGVLPEIGVLHIGDPLVFERPFYAGFTPARMNRATDVIGNMSRTGELLGRSNKRTILEEGPQWQNLTYDWVRANLDGPRGVIQSLEIKPAFMAWRPEAAPQDTSYIMRGTPTAPSAQGRRDLWSFAMSAEVYAYE